MKGYIVCVYKSIKNEKALKDYAVIAKEAVEQYNGKFLVRGGNKLTTEGEEWVRTTIIEFPSFQEAKNFYYSNEYKKAHTILEGTVTRHHHIIEGF